MRSTTTRVIFYLLFFCLPFLTNAETIVAVQNGNWADGDTWSTKRMPTRNDAIIIPQGITVSVTSPLIVGPNENGKALVIAVGGILNIASASIYLDPIDRIVIMPGGKISTKSFGGMVFSGTYAQYLEGGTNARGPITIGDGYSVPAIYELTAESDAKGVTLAWRSGSEIEVNYYHVLRSTDGINYETIGKVDGRGSRKQKLFSFVDARHPGGTVHYRVDLTNMNGVGGSVATVDVVTESTQVAAPVVSDKATHKK